MIIIITGSNAFLRFLLPNGVGGVSWNGIVMCVVTGFSETLRCGDALSSVERCGKASVAMMNSLCKMLRRNRVGLWWIMMINILYYECIRCLGIGLFSGFQQAREGFSSSWLLRRGSRREEKKRKAAGSFSPWLAHSSRVSLRSGRRRPNPNPRAAPPPTPAPAGGQGGGGAMARRGKGGGLGDAARAAWRRGSARLVVVSAVAWALLLLAFHLWSCASPSAYFLSALCRKDTQVVHRALDPMGTPSKPLHRCSIPVADDPDTVVIPKRTPNAIVKKLSYLTVDKRDKGSPPLFGGRQNWKQREESFKLNATMKVHCGFMKNSGADMDDVDVEYIQKCKFVVASGIFDGYDIPHQPSNISLRSQKLFCFLMVVDEVSLEFIEQNVTVKVDSAGGKWVGIWRLITLHRPPFDEPRRNGKVPKILTHRLFPRAWYSIWIDGKMELMVDPLLILERYLWRGKYTFAVAVHKHHRSIYEEGDAIKRRKRYARPLVDLQMKIYYHEGMEPWDANKRMPSDIPEGAVLIREHTTITDLFSCLWFNEVNLFTPRDQLSFGYVVHRLGDALKFFMFPNCEYNSLFILHRHTREHSSKVEWAKTIDEILKKGLKESRGGLGLWTPYPADLSSVELPAVKRTSQAG